MPEATTIDYDVINRGAYKINARIEKRKPVFTFGQSVLFDREGATTPEEFMTYDYAEHGTIIPKEALRGTDPNRRNYGLKFNENHIASLFYFDELSFNIQNAYKRLPFEDLTRPLSITQRLMYLVAEARDAWSDGVSENIEKAVWSVILNGYFNARNGGKQAFPVKDEMLTLQGANIFTNPMQTLQDACKKVTAEGGLVSQIIFNSKDWVNLISNNKFLKLMDNRSYVGSTVSSTRISNGASVAGYINIPGIGTIKAVTYAGTDSEGNDYLPQGKAVVMDENLGFIGHCGVMVVVGDYQGMEGIPMFAYLFRGGEGVNVETKLHLEAAPCPVLTAINKYGVISGIPADDSTESKG